MESPQTIAVELSAIADHLEIEYRNRHLDRIAPTNYDARQRLYDTAKREAADAATLFLRAFDEGFGDGDEQLTEIVNCWRDRPHSFFLALCEHWLYANDPRQWHWDRYLLGYGYARAIRHLASKLAKAPEVNASGDVAGAIIEIGDQSNRDGEAGAMPVESERPIAETASRSVLLFGRRAEPLVNGKEKPTLTNAQYDVVLALLQTSDKGLTKDDLDRKSKHGDARKILKRLSDGDADWESVISFPGATGKGYHII
jgi:hypothetical protein